MLEMFTDVCEYESLYVYAKSHVPLSKKFIRSLGYEQLCMILEYSTPDTTNYKYMLKRKAKFLKQDAKKLGITGKNKW